MGGVLARDFIINHPETWQQLNSKKDSGYYFRCSLGDSFRIPYVLFGKDTIIN
jgi:hypothetical protein